MSKGNSSHNVFAHITIGLQLAITVLAFLIGGYKLDNYYDKSPIFVTLGAFIGMSLGFYHLLKELQGISKKEKLDDKENGKKRVKWM